MIRSSARSGHVSAQCRLACAIVCAFSFVWLVIGQPVAVADESMPFGAAHAVSETTPLIAAATDGALPTTGAAMAHGSAPVTSSVIMAVDSKNQVREFVRGDAFNMLFGIAVALCALSSILVAVELGYDFWGRLVFGFTASLGGGTIRDLLIGGDRLPFVYTRDPTFMSEILIITAVVSVLSATRAGFHQSRGFQAVKRYTDIIGFTLLATTGACVAVASRLEWFWVPLCAALTCAGGGALRDLAAHRYPNTFRGVIFEEIAMAGGLVLVAGLYFAHRFSNDSVPVDVPITVAGAFIAITRLIVVKKDIRYPTKLLFKARRLDSAEVPIDPTLGPVPQQLRLVVTTQSRQWQVPHDMLLNAVKAIDEALAILTAAGRGLPTHLHLEYDETILKVVLAHPGAPIDTAVANTIDPLSAIDQAHVDQWFVNSAIQLALEYATSIQSAQIDATTATLTLSFASTPADAA